MPVSAGEPIPPSRYTGVVVHIQTTQAIVGGNIHFVCSFAFSVKCTKACTIVKCSFLVREPSINGFYPLTQSFILKAEIESKGICVYEE